MFAYATVSTQAFSALLRELAETNRFVQESAESTSIWPSSRILKFGPDVPAHRLFPAQSATGSTYAKQDVRMGGSWLTVFVTFLPIWVTLVMLKTTSYS